MYQKMRSPPQNMLIVSVYSIAFAISRGIHPKQHASQTQLKKNVKTERKKDKTNHLNVIK